MNNGIHFPNPVNLAFVERLYEEYLRDASAVSPEWRDYFSEIARGELRFPRPRFGPSFQPFSLFNPPSLVAPAKAGFADRTTASLQDRIYLLIRLYRVRGHRIARDS